MMMLGLSGTADSKAKRLALMKSLSLPEHLSANGLLQALNLLYTRDELYQLVGEEI
jgi:ribonuclease M5